MSTKKSHALMIDEGERQATLMALAHLAVERPGWDIMLSEIASRIDNPTEDGPELYSKFKKMRAEVVNEIMLTLQGISKSINLNVGGKL